MQRKFSREFPACGQNSRRTIHLSGRKTAAQLKAVRLAPNLDRDAAPTVTTSRVSLAMASTGIIYHSKIRGAIESRCSTTLIVSEEKNGGRLVFSGVGLGDVSGRKFAKSMRCAGRYCDNKDFVTCALW